MDSIAGLFDYWFIPIIPVGIGVLVFGAHRFVRNRPTGRSSAMQRLIERNPAIMFNDVRWSVSAKRVRTTWVTGFVVAAALLIATDRPVPQAAS